MCCVEIYKPPIIEEWVVVEAELSDRMAKYTFSSDICIENPDDDLSIISRTLFLYFLESYIEDILNHM